MTQQHGLTWGALDFVSETPTEQGFVVAAMSDGTGFGNPEPVVEIVQSLLTDGALAVTQRWDNREVTVRLRLSGDTGSALAAAEAALFGEVLAEEKSPLVWTPPADDAAVTVFDVVNARLDRDNGDDWDLDEVMRLNRFFTLTLTCLPFARREETTVAAALDPAPGSPTTVTVDTCDSLTGWSSSQSNQSLIDGGAYLQVTTTIDRGVGTLMSITRTGAVSMTGTPYLRVEASRVPGTPAPADFEATFDGGASVKPVASASGSGTTVNYYFEAPASFSTLRLDWTIGAPTEPGQGFRVHHIDRTNTLVGDGTAREQGRLVTVDGSAPTTAALRVYDATPAALGADILIHTSCCTDLLPPLRRWRVSSSTVTADTSMVSGARNTLASAMVFEAPASLFTDGVYGLLARMSITSGADLTWSARMVNSAGATTLGSSVIQSGTVTLSTTSGYQVVRLGALTLPVVAVEGDQMVELTLTGTSNMTIDQAWLFGLHDGALTWIKDTDSMTWVEIRSPELGSSRPSVWGGTAADRSDGVCVDYKCESFGVHQFDPGEMQVFTVTTTSLLSQSEIEFYPRYHSHVAPEPEGE